MNTAIYAAGWLAGFTVRVAWLLVLPAIGALALLGAWPW